MLAISACTGGASSPAASPLPAASTPPAASAPASSAPAASAPAASAAASASAAAGAETVKVGESSLGQILVDGEGRTLYAFTPDSAGEPTCYEGCAQAWPPLLAEGDIAVGPGLDATMFTTVARTDAGMQVKVGDWPLYHFAQDAAPGDTNGQGKSDKWYVVSPTGELIK
jgi:predicted lipoprotein with Yx(FWY)xxD motif